MTKFAVDLAIGDWSAHLDQVDPGTDAEPVDGALALAGLEMTWDLDSDVFPGRPTPTQLKMGLYVPDITTGPEPRQGDVVAFTLATEGYMRNRLPNSNMAVPEDYDFPATFQTYQMFNVTTVRQALTTGRWELKATTTSAGVGNLSQKVGTATVVCKPGDKCWAAAELVPGTGSGLTKFASRIRFIGADGLELAAGSQPALGAVFTQPVANQPVLVSTSAVAPAGAVAFRGQFGPQLASEIQVGDVFKLRDPFLAVSPLAALSYTKDNLEPVATFDGRISDVEADVYRDGLVYQFNAVDYVSELNEVTVGDEPWPEEFWAYSFTLGEDGRYRRIAALIRDTTTYARSSGLNVVENLTAPVDSDALLAVDPMTPAASGAVGGVTSLKPKDVDAQQAGDLLEALCRQMVIAVNPGLREARWFIGTHSGGHHPALSYWITPIMGQGVNDNGVVSLFPVWITDRVPDNGFASQATVASDGILRLADMHTSTIDPGHAVHVPASVVDRGDVVWRMDKQNSPNHYREDSTGDTTIFFNEKDGAFLYAVWTGTDASTWEWRVPAYQVAWWPLVLSNGAVQVKQENDLTNDLVGTIRYLPILGRYYDAQPVYMVDQLTIYPAELDGEDWPRLFAHRNPWGYFSGHVGRWVYVHGIDDRWNPHPHGLYFGQLTGATLRIDEDGKVSMVAQLRHRHPGAAGPSGALHLEDVPAGVNLNEIDSSVRFVDLSVASRTVQVIP